MVLGDASARVTAARLIPCAVCESQRTESHGDNVDVAEGVTKHLDPGGELEIQFTQMFHEITLNSSVNILFA